LVVRRLKTLNKDRYAVKAVGKASQMKQSGDLMDFGLLCYEMGRMSTKRIASYSVTECLLIGEPDLFQRFYSKYLKKGET
jgi:hypothetical protein